MTERRRLPKKPTSPEWLATHDRNVSFEWAALKCTCTVKCFAGGGSADVRCGDEASHLQHRVKIPCNNNKDARARRTPADDHLTPVGSPRHLPPVRVKSWRVAAKLGKVRSPNGYAAQCLREPSSSTARSTLTSPVKRAFICSFSTRANPARRQ